MRYPGDSDCSSDGNSPDNNGFEPLPPSIYDADRDEGFVTTPSNSTSPASHAELPYYLKENSWPIWRVDYNPAEGNSSTLGVHCSPVLGLQGHGYATEISTCIDPQLLTQPSSIPMLDGQTGYQPLSDESGSSTSPTAHQHSANNTNSRAKARKVPKKQRKKAQGPFQCPECGKICRIQSALDKHMNQHNKPEKCTLCPYRGERPGAIRRHFKSCHADLPPIQCPLPPCKSTIAGKRKDNMQRHLRDQHSLPEERIEELIKELDYG